MILVSSPSEVAGCWANAVQQTSKPTIKIKDAGYGFAPERMSDYRKPVSLGLVAMEDRLSKVEVAK